MDDALPPLPRPLVPTHSRSFSSSSSSSSSSAASLERDPEASAADPRWWNDAQSASPSRQQLAVDSAGLDGTSPPLGMLADDQPFADSFLTAHRSGSADDDDDDEPDSRQDLSRSAISAADLDFPRSSTSPHSQAGHHSLLSRDSPNPISASPAPNRSSSDTSIASPVEQQKQTTLRRAPRASDDEFSSKPEPQTGGLPASASVASDLGGGGTFRRRAPFASAAAAAEEDRVLDDGDETSVGAAATAAAPLDETLLRRRKYRARGSYTPSTPVSPDGMASGTSADLSARSRRILDEMNSRGGGGGGGVASSSAIQDPALRRTATVETLRGARTASRAGSTTVDEFGSVSGGAGSQTVPRSRTTNDLLLDGDTDPQRSDTGRSLGRSASTTASTSTSSRTYGYRSGSRAAQVLASIRPSTAASPYYDPSPATTTGRMSRTRPSNHHHENGALPPPPPLPTSTSMYQLRSAPPVRDRASTALDTTEARDRDSGRWGYHVSPQGAEDAVRTRRTPLSVERNSRELLFGARRRGGAEEQEDYASSSPRHVVAGRAATSLGTASLTRRQRDHPLGARSFSDNDDDGDEKASGHHFDHRRSIVRAGTSLGTPNRSRRNIGLAELSNAAKSRRQVNGSEQFSSVAGRTVDDMLDDESELERTPRSGKKSSGGTAIPSTGSHDNVPRALYPDLYAARSPPLAAEAVSRSTGTRSIRRERSVTGSESGSEAWLAEAERARHRTNKSRATGGGSSDDGDAASVVTTRTQADVDRDRTVRAINDLLREQGIVAAVASDSFSVASRTSSSSSPRKRDSVNGGLANRSDLPPSRAASHRLAIGRDSPAALPASRSMHNDLSRRSSMLSVAPGRPETALRGLIDRAGPSAAEHHTLLFAALDQFDKHFTEAAQREGGPTAPTSPASAVAFSPAIDLVKRTDGLVNSTTRLNTGLRGLLEAIKSDQVEAQLAEDGEPRRSSPLAHFERSVNALLRISEDQVRSLTEDLVAVIRFDRDRTHVATSGVAVDNRPTSRASTYRSSLAGSAVRSGDFIQSPPRRATTASPYEGSTVSHASVRSPTAIRQTLRDPLLDEQSPSSRVSSQLAFQRHTVGYAGGTPSPRSSLAQMGGTPSPAARRESVHARSPLSDVAAAYETPSRVSSLRRRRAANSIVASASYSGPNGLTGLSLPLPRSEPNSEDQPRRSKTSDTTVRPSSPTQTRVSGAAYPVTSVDSTQATTQSSPTHPSAGFEVASQAHDRDLPDLPQTSPVVGPQRFPTTGTEGLRPTISATSAMTLPVESPTSSRKRSIRLSGGIGAAIKNAFTSGSRKPASEGVVQNSSSASKTASPPLLPALPGSVSTIPLERTSSRASGLEERRRDSQRLSRRD